MATKFPPVDLSPKREVVVKARWERTISVAPYEPERVEISAHLDLQVRDADVEAEVEMAAEKGPTGPVSADAPRADRTRRLSRWPGGVRVLLVGESNPYGPDQRYALWPRPENASGGRLCKVLGMTPATYLRTFDRVNLCLGGWNLRDARDVAAGLTHPRRVLLGRRVAQAHGIKDWRPFEVYDLGPLGRDVLALPHPSGRCRIWNEPGAAQRARGAVALLWLRRD